MKCTFHQYLIDVGFRASSDYSYDRYELIKYISFFRKCWNDGISAYIALNLLSDEIDKEVITPKFQVFNLLELKRLDNPQNP